MLVRQISFNLASPMGILIVLKLLMVSWDLLFFVY